MPRRTSDLEQVRRAAYFLQRFLGDVQAAKRGTLPQRLMRRPVRRRAGRATKGWL